MYNYGKILYYYFIIILLTIFTKPKGNIYNLYGKKDIIPSYSKTEKLFIEAVTKLE